MWGGREEDTLWGLNHIKLAKQNRKTDQVVKEELGRGGGRGD